MGKVLSSIKHPFRNFNVEDRAHKVISRSKPSPAPLHHKDKSFLEKLTKEHPEILEEVKKKHTDLDSNLRQVYVTSRDYNPEVMTNPERPLPLDRSAVEPFIFGVKEPVRMPPGKVTLKQALQFITNHQADPKVYTIKKISEEFSVPESTLEKILKNFRILQVYVPNEKTLDPKFAGPSLPKIEVVRMPQKQLPASDPKDTKDNT